MARKFIKLPSLSNVVANSRATLSVPVGVTYHKIDFKYSGISPSQMKNIRVKINGKPIQEFLTGTRLNDINKYYKRHVENNIITLWFDSTHFDNIALRRATAIGTMDVSTFEIEFDIDSSATNPVIEATCHVRDASLQCFFSKMTLTDAKFQSTALQCMSLTRFWARKCRETMSVYLILQNSPLSTSTSKATHRKA